ncbi:S-adenosyl-L-methionine: L-methionine S-methyltransferase [Streptomyces mobaraensis NBRC 13819 = DSM 40847]|nr:S-adenosyl-L-methionine: L-methionine S-methyltransferase [Streptomyces mobaraensis NBRC 13819 = DSM 40847]
MPSEHTMLAPAPAPASVPDPAPASVPSFTFDPSDPWTVTFQAGLERAGLRGRRVYEVGVGSGANVLHLLRRCGAAHVTASDLDPRLPPLARRFVMDAAPGLAGRCRFIEGSVSLVDGPAATEAVVAADTVVACLPQVPDPGDAMYTRFRAAHLRTGPETGGPLRITDHAAHYYPWSAFDDHPFNAVGLGLIEALLRRVRARAPRAEVVLNLGCRIGKDVLTRLFRAHGYRPEELASRVVPQDGRTDITFFAALEAALRGTGHEKDFTCSFSADPEGRRPLSATEAADRLAADPGTPVFHEICVLRGRPTAFDDVPDEEDRR